MLKNAPRVSDCDYSWWYFDGVSDDGRFSCVAIFLVGSVFSPSLAARLRRGEAVNAREHVAVNLAVYERGRPRVWVMSEYAAPPLANAPSSGSGAGEPTGERLTIGTSTLSRSGASARIDFEERSAPFLVALTGRGSRVAGTLALDASAAPLPRVAIDDDHDWQAVMPRARLRLRLDEPRISFDGVGYHDVNRGRRRLERSFKSWSWARFHDGNRTLITYGVRKRDGGSRAFFAEARDDGGSNTDDTVTDATLDDGPPRAAGWGLSLPSRVSLTAARGDRAPLVVTPSRIWDVSPFYARYAATLGDGARTLDGIGEHLDLDRFSAPSIQFLLRFKTRRAR
jgi:carotenoid 1,2-hydratase